MTSGSRCRLVVVGSAEDRQAAEWFALGRGLNAASQFLDCAQFGREWWIEHSANSTLLVRRADGLSICGDDLDTCWYLRGPDYGPQAILQGLSLLHWLLCEEAYPKGNYLCRRDEEWFVSAKLSQLSAARLVRVPVTRVRKGLHLSNAWQAGMVVKSVSGTRSIAVAADDRRLRCESASYASPTQHQARIEGVALKTHFYRTRNDTWREFTIVASSSAVDYRYSTASYRLHWTPAEAFLLADWVYRQLGTRFFDIDFMLGEAGLIFLEVNVSPAPALFEKHTLDGARQFSSRVLADWLEG
jgi:hypothetical protein